MGNLKGPSEIVKHTLGIQCKYFAKGKWLILPFVLRGAKEQFGGFVGTASEREQACHKFRNIQASATESSALEFNCLVFKPTTYSYVCIVCIYEGIKSAEVAGTFVLYCQWCRNISCGNHCLPVPVCTQQYSRRLM